MPRYPSRGYYSCDQNGAIIQGATVVVYLAGTTTPANFYLAQAGGVHVTSMTSDLTTGFFKFWIDSADYSSSQLFDITVSKTVFGNVAYQQAVLYSESIVPISGLAPYDLGPVAADPSTVGLAAGTKWFNTTTGNFKGWNGTFIVLLG